jgi:hypothetical protein
MFVPGKLQIIRPAPKSVQAGRLVTLNVTEGGVKDLLYLPFDNRREVPLNQNN